MMVLLVMAKGGVFVYVAAEKCLGAGRDGVAPHLQDRSHWEVLRQAH